MTPNPSPRRPRRRPLGATPWVQMLAGAACVLTWALLAADVNAAPRFDPITAHVTQ
jgi:hypothetical protein